MYLELFLGDRIYSLMILKKNKYTIFFKKTLKIYSYKEFVNLINMTNKYAPKRSTSILTDCTYGNSHECIFKNW